MISPWLTRRRLALGAAVALLLGGTALLSYSAVTSEVASSAVLGNQWQCRSFALLTTCTRVDVIMPVAHRLGGNQRGRPGV